MMSAILLLLVGLTPAHGSATETSCSSSAQIAPELSCPQPILSAIESDADWPYKEYGLPDGTKEREGEEEGGDGDDSEIAGAQFGLPVFHRPLPTCAGIAVANRWFLGLGPIARIPYLRC